MTFLSLPESATAEIFCDHRDTETSAGVLMKLGPKVGLKKVTVDS